MLVAVALFEINIPHAQSLKEKRMVVKSLRDRIRGRFEVSAAEVGMQDVHQRARLGISFVAGDRQAVDRMFEKLIGFIESSVDGALTGWTTEVLEFDEDASLGVPGIEIR